MKRMRIALIAEIIVIVCLLIAIFVVVKNKNENSKESIAGGTDASESSGLEVGKNDLTSDEKIEYSTIIYRTSALMAIEGVADIKLSESAKQRLGFVVDAYSMNTKHGYEDNLRSIAYISFDELKSDYEALYGQNYNFEQDYESAATQVTKPCPAHIAADGILCFDSNTDYAYSYFFDEPVITGQKGTYEMTGTYRKVDNANNETVADLKYSVDFKDSFLLNFTAPAEL